MYSVEVYTPGEIVAERHPLQAANLRDAKLEMYAWLAISGAVEKATSYRLVENGPGTVLLDKLLAEPY